MKYLSEVEILRKLATSLERSNYYKKKYDEMMRDYNRLHPFVDARHNKKNINERTKQISPVYSKYKEYKRQAEGYLFVWSTNHKGEK